MKMQFSMAKLSAALKLVSQETKKAEVDIVNKAVKDVGFRAMQFTPFAEPGLIQAQLYRDKIAIKMAVKRISKRAGRPIVNTRGTVKLGRGGSVKTHSGLTKAEIAKEAALIIRKAVASSKAMRAGWIPGLRRIGAQVSGGARLKAGGTAAQGTGQKATIGNLTSFIENALFTRSRATGKRMSIGQIRDAVRALKRAIDVVTSDRFAYARKKAIGKILRKHSDR
jgi:hypothetical protein